MWDKVPQHMVLNRYTTSSQEKDLLHKHPLYKKKWGTKFPERGHNITPLFVVMTSSKRDLFTNKQ